MSIALKATVLLSRRAALVLLAGVLAGCAGMLGAPSVPPRVSLADIGVEEVGLLEQKLRLDLRVQNPNDAVLGIQGINYEVEVNGRKLADGVSGQSWRVPRLGEARVSVSATVGTAGLLRQLRDLQIGSRDAIAYRLRGTLLLEGGGSSPFDQQGEIPMPALFGR